ncbi:MAG: glycogen debranching enzyme family protein [Planctomycetes bacterium]|nr:glycogen debranching enzyme family protein [Planctomycetota bacterium]
MLTQKDSDSTAIAVSIQGKPIDSLLEKEWLLTNSRGGFASGTVVGCNTRRYHGLLIGTQTPPANRIAAFSNCIETVACEDRTFSPSCFEFDHTLHPTGYKHLLEFRKGLGIHFEYDLDVTRLAKSIYLLPDSDIVAVVYEFSDVRKVFDFSVRPFAAMRDFHALQNSNAPLNSVWDEYILSLSGQSADLGQLAFRCESMHFEQQPQWWHHFMYRAERQRGQDCFEDLWSPGHYKCCVDGPQRIILWAGLFEDEQNRHILGEMDLETAIDAIALDQKEQLGSAVSADPATQKLHLAAGQFVIEREINDKVTPTILAGYPWFLDWGRDTFISLEGICLSTGHHDIAWGVLKTFAEAVSEGMIPNRFDDYGNEPHYNSIDASLWFVHAAFQYLKATDDLQNFSVKLLPAVKWIMDSYRKGTRFGIHADKDKLITGGDIDTQLTWMDAKHGGITFTPRYGKAVEINALWYSNLCHLAEFYRNKNGDDQHFYRETAEQVRLSFQELFWNEAKGYLNDCILPTGKADTSLRPNQIFAVSLPFTPLNINQAKKVVDAIEKELLTPYGLRSLSPNDPRYKSHYTGSMAQRDAAYHQGTVWGWLIGPFVQAYLKTHGSSPITNRQCRGFLTSLIQHLEQDGCLGNISEIFDGDKPHRPRGTFAQAWSVAEVLRTWKMVQDK